MVISGNNGVVAGMAGDGIAPVNSALSANYQKIFLLDKFRPKMLIWG